VRSIYIFFLKIHCKILADKRKIKLSPELLQIPALGIFRMQHQEGRFPNTAWETIFKERQFSVLADHRAVQKELKVPLESSA
jgi:hypothetical protein